MAALGAAGDLSVGAPLLLVGAGGFGRETAELVRAINADHVGRSGERRWNLLGFLDDDPARWGDRVGEAAILGPVDRIAEHPDAAVVLCTGHPGNFGSKRTIAERLALAPARYATLVHPAAALADSCRLGEGTVVLAGVVATADVTVGRHVGVMPQTVLTHDVRLADYVTVGAGACLAGSVGVEAGAYLGSGCLIREGRTIGAGALVGMGAVVTRDVPPGEVWAGVPAGFIRAAG